VEDVAAAVEERRAVVVVALALALAQLLAGSYQQSGDRHSSARDWKLR